MDAETQRMADGGHMERGESSTSVRTTIRNRPCLRKLAFLKGNGNQEEKDALPKDELVQNQEYSTFF